MNLVKMCLNGGESHGDKLPPRVLNGQHHEREPFKRCVDFFQGKFHFTTLPLALGVFFTPGQLWTTQFELNYVQTEDWIHGTIFFMDAYNSMRIKVHSKRAF